MVRQTYPKMRKGENCGLDYDPLKMKSCSKCGKPGTMNLNATSMKDTASKSAQFVTDYTTLQEIAKSWKSSLPMERNSTALS